VRIPDLNPLSFARESLTQPGRERGVGFHSVGLGMRRISRLIAALCLLVVDDARADLITPSLILVSLIMRNGRRLFNTIEMSRAGQTLELTS